MLRHITQLATVTGALIITLSLGCGNNQSPLSSAGSFSDMNAAAEAIATLEANAIDAELLALSNDIEEVPVNGTEPLPNEHPPPRFDRLQEALGLTDDQMAQIREIVDASRESRTAIHEQVRDGALTREEAREQFKAVHEDTRVRIEAVMTDEQRAQFEELRAEHGRQFNRHPLGNFLNLTDEQRAQLETIMQEIRDQIHTIRQQVETGEMTRDEAIEQIHSLRGAELEQLSSILDEDQLARFSRILRHKRFGFGPRGFGRGPRGEFHRPGPGA